MGTTEVILTENVPALGYVGDIVKVKKGYARNYLIPQRLASELVAKTRRGVEHLKEQVLKKKAEKLEEAKLLGQKLSGLKLEFLLKGSKQGRVFGSVTSKDVATRLHEAGYVIDRRQIKLAEPIKAVGESRIPVKLHDELIVDVVISVAIEAGRGGDDLNEIGEED